MHDNADYRKLDVLRVLDRIEDEHHIRTLHQADMSVWRSMFPCACEAMCHCGDEARP